MVTDVGTDELKQFKILIKQVLAEFVGTFLYLSLATIAATGSPSLVTEAFANGLLVATIVQIIGHVSGGHINPAVTIGALVHGDMKLIKSLLYIIAQILGSIMGSAVSYLLVPSSTARNLGVTTPNVLSPVQAFGIETLTTFLLVSVVIICTRRLILATPLAIGLSVTACLCACNFYTGSLNPVRSLGPAVVMNSWSDHWVYWAGPISGGVLAGLVHRLMFSVSVTVRTVSVIDN